MSKYKFILFLILLSLVACQEKQAQLKFSNDLITVENVNVSKKDSVFNFTIYNTGNDDLLIEKYICNCGCALIKMADSTRILPKDSLLVDFIIDYHKNDTSTVSCTFRANTEEIFHTLTLQYNPLK